MVYAKRRPRAQQVGYCKTGKEKERKRNENPSKGLALKVQTVPIHPMVGFVVAGSLPKSLNLGLLKLVYNLGGGGGCSLEVNMLVLWSCAQHDLKNEPHKEKTKQNKKRCISLTDTGRERDALATMVTCLIWLLYQSQSSELFAIVKWVLKERVWFCSFC